MKSKRCQEHKVTAFCRSSYIFLGLKKRDVLKQVEEAAIAADQRTANDTTLIGREYFRNPDVNLGFYSRKRQGVADVDPKVISNF